MKGTIDGDQLCLTTDHFINLQESPAVFVPLDGDIAQRFQKDGMCGLTLDEVRSIYRNMIKRIPQDNRCCPNWGSQPGQIGLGPCGHCEWCEIMEWIE